MSFQVKIAQDAETAQTPDLKLAWFRITVVVISAGICTGEFLLWLHP